MEAKRGVDARWSAVVEEKGLLFVGGNEEFFVIDVQAPRRPRPIPLLGLDETVVDIARVDGGWLAALGDRGLARIDLRSVDGAIYMPTVGKGESP